MSDARRRRAVRRGGAILAVSGVLAALAGSVGVVPSPALSGALVGVAAVAAVGAALFDRPSLRPVWVGSALLAAVALVVTTTGTLLRAGVGLAVAGLALWGVPALAAARGE